MSTLTREQDERLTRECPRLYRDRQRSIHESCMGWGFDGVPSAWWQILYELSCKLELLIQEWIIEHPEFTECICGQSAKTHEDGIGRCLETYRVPIKWATLNKWGYYSIPIEIVESRKLKNRLFVWWKRSKHKIKCRGTSLLYWLCEKNLIYKTVDSNCTKFRLNHPAAAQIKEKFASLTVYMTHSTIDMRHLIEEARSRSLKICAECGEPGSLRRDGWWIVLCDVHAAEHGRDPSVEDDDDSEDFKDFLD